MRTAVLDEADRILDMGFAATLNAIVASLPRTRQTLLFSATQTKSVRDLARLSLKVRGQDGPLYVDTGSCTTRRHVSLSLCVCLSCVRLSPSLSVSLYVSQ
jgi:superfamily II DNA/RNA helicase